MNSNQLTLTKQLFDTAQVAARVLIARIIAQAQRQPCYHIALSGGSTPDILFSIWAQEYAALTPWDKLRFYWVDERCVPPTQEASNFGRFATLLMQHVPALQADKQVFRLRGEDDPDTEATRYAALVQGQVGTAFDLVLLGIGEDGHTSSIFPSQEALLTASTPYAPSVHPTTGMQRIAMTGAPMCQARQTVFLVAGSGKEDIVDQILHHAYDCPARWVMLHAKNPELIGDKEALQALMHR